MRADRGPKGNTPAEYTRTRAHKNTGQKRKQQAAQKLSEKITSNGAEATRSRIK